MNSEYLVKFFRKRKKLTQPQIAKLLGVTERHYRNFEKDLSNIKMKTFYRIADILDLSIAEEIDLISEVREELIRNTGGKNNGNV